MKLSILITLLTLIPSQVFAYQCPTEELEGRFKVVETQGCEGALNLVTHVENVMQASLFVTGFVFNNSEVPSQSHWIEEEMNSAQIDCVNTSTTKSWRWFPQSSRTSFYWGFAYRAGTYYAERGHSCRYKLQKL